MAPCVSTPCGDHTTLCSTPEPRNLPGVSQRKGSHLPACTATAPDKSPAACPALVRAGLARGRSPPSPRGTSGGCRDGGIGIWQAFKGAGWGTGILAAISVIFGIVLLANVWVSAFALPWVLGIFSLVGGIAAIVIAFRRRSR